MDDYQKEIADLETQIEQLVEADGDAKTIAELTMQAEILKAIYARALDLLDRGRKDESLRFGLRWARARAGLPPGCSWRVSCSV